MKRSIALFLTVALATGCFASPSEEEAPSTEADLTSSKKPAAAPALPDGRYVVLGSVPGSTSQLGAVTLTQREGVRFVDLRTLHASTSNVPVNADGTFSKLGAPSGSWQWKYDGRVTFDGETLRYELTETQVAPGWSTYRFQGALGIGSVLVQAAASNGGTFRAGVTSQTVTGSWFAGYPIMTQLVYLRTKAGRVFLTEPDSLASKGCLRGFALEVPSVGGPAATLATATGATCDGMDPCNTHYSARLVARAGSVSYSCQRGGESHSISAPPPSFAP